MTTKAPKPDEWNDDINWLINEMPGHLGLKAQSISDVGPGGTICDNWDHIEKLHNCRWAVRKARRLEAIWKELDQETRAILVGRYEQKPHPFGFKPAFAELAGVVIVIEADLSQIEAWCSRLGRNEKAILRVQRRAAKASKQAHAAWKHEKEHQARMWAEGVA